MQIIKAKEPIEAIIARRNSTNNQFYTELPSVPPPPLLLYVWVVEGGQPVKLGDGCVMIIRTYQPPSVPPIFVCTYPRHKK